MTFFDYTPDASATLLFNANDLLSKWGFGDGDMLADLLNDAFPVRHPTGFSSDVLEAVVRTYVVPCIPRAVEVHRIGTIHNPIRAHKVDGEDVTQHWYDEFSMDWPTVEVSVGDILALAREIMGRAQ